MYPPADQSPHPPGPGTTDPLDEMALPPASTPPESMGRIATASLIGTAIEFYDFYIYGIAAALILNEAFFPNLSAVTATLASFSTYAVAFIARPLGSVIFGHFGDRLGRKSMLVVSLLLMGLSTVAIGLLPSYSTWGLWAPIALVTLRFLQGIGLGGEWGGAALLAVEHAPAKRRGLFAAFPQLGPSLGFFAATAVFLALSTSLSDKDFSTWGWRVPFVASIILVAVGLMVRLKISETPAFAKVMARNDASRLPFVQVLRGHSKELLLGAGAMTAAYGLFYTATTYCLSYATGPLGVERNTMLVVSLVAVLFLAAGTWLAAVGSDTFGRRKLVLAGTAVTTLWGFALFPLMDTTNPLLITLALSGALFCMGLIYGPMGAYLPELFQIRVRYSGASLAYNLGGVLGGALTPIVAARLQSGVGSSAVGWYVSALGVISLCCVLLLPETRQRNLYASVG